MRIPHLIVQGLIAGAILLIPNEAFAEKGQNENQRDVVAQKSQSYHAENNSRDVRPTRQEAQTDHQPSSHSAAKAQNNVSHKQNQGSEMSSQVSHSSGTHPNSSYQRQEPTNSEPQKNHSEQIKGNQLSRMSETVKNKSSKAVIHKETPIVKPVNQSANKNVKPTKKIVRKAAVSVAVQKRVPIDIPLDKMPEYPADSKVIPGSSAQSSTHSSSTTDGGNGTSNMANLKANLAIPLIINDDKKVAVYFSRMDLLRSQWVNAPPSEPPETAL